MTRQRTFIAAMLVLVMLTCLAGPALAADVKGTISLIRVEQKQFVLTENFKDITFRLDAGAQIVINGNNSSLAELRPGDAAVITYRRQGTAWLALKVDVTRNKAATAAGPE